MAADNALINALDALRAADYSHALSFVLIFSTMSFPCFTMQTPRTPAVRV